MDNIPLIVGAIFFALGINIIIGFYRFKMNGMKVKGRVKAIEKYISVTKGADNSRSRATMFCALVEYSFRGDTRIVKSISTNEIRHKLGQVLPVMVIKNNEGKIQARIDDSMYILMGMAFTLVGLIAVAVYLFVVHGDIVVVAATLIGLTTGGGLLTPLLNRFKVPMHAGEDDQTSRKDATIIETHEAFQKEIRTYSRIGYILAWGGLLIGVGMLYWGYDSTTGYGFSPGEFIRLITDISGLIDLIKSGQLHSKWHKPLILFAMGSLSTLGSLHSLIYQRRKYGALSRR